MRDGDRGDLRDIEVPGDCEEGVIDGYLRLAELYSVVRFGGCGIMESLGRPDIEAKAGFRTRNSCDLELADLGGESSAGHSVKGRVERGDGRG